MPNAGGKGCGLANLRAMLDIAMQDGRPHLSGPLRGEALACRDAGIAIAKPAADVDVRFGKALDRWTGRVDLMGEALRSGGMVLARPAGRNDLDGTADAPAGRARIGAAAVQAGGGGREQDVGGTRGSGR